jgi:hypothetical protein
MSQTAQADLVALKPSKLLDGWQRTEIQKSGSIPIKKIAADFSAAIRKTSMVNCLRF